MLQINTFTYAQATYCLPGYQRSASSSTNCTVATEPVDYTNERGGTRMKYCPTAVLSTIRRTSVAVEALVNSVPVFCQVCSGGLVMNNRTECLYSDQVIANCDFYQTAGVCDQCLTGYVLQTGNTCGLLGLYTKIANCYVYSTNLSRCSSCQLGYLLQEDYSCSFITHCDMSFLGNNSCVRCEDPYFYDSLTHACITSCDVNKFYSCGACRTPNPYCLENNLSICPEDITTPISCRSCVPGSNYTSTGVCSKCGDNCTSCEENTRICTACTAKTAVNPNNKVVCGACSDNCDACSTPGSCNAGRCSEGYYYWNSTTLCIFSDQCALTMEHCASCVFFNDANNGGLNAKKCMRCDEGYRVNSDQQGCTLCNISHCTTCSSAGLCAACDSGFELSNDLSKPQCISKQLHATCSQYNNNGECIKCQHGFVANPLGQCIHAHGCAKVQFNDVTLNYAPYCMEQGFNDTCISTATLNPAVANLMCLNEGCTTYSSTEGLDADMPNDAACLTCTADTYFIYDYHCYPCEESCATCKPEPSTSGSAVPYYSTCLTCKNTDYIVSNTTGLCVPCSEYSIGCSKCTFAENTLTCTMASTGYYINSNHLAAKCSDAIPNCELCSSDALCTQCADGTQFIAAESKCKTCQDLYGDHCDGCDATKCTVFDTTKYYADTTGKLQSCGNEQCTDCTSDHKCAGCIAGYALLNHTVCASCATLFGNTCNECTADSCTSCQYNLGYSIEKRRCVSCSDAYGYQCLGCNAQFCVNCQDDYGFSASANKCQACSSSSCAECAFIDSGEICLQCKRNEYRPAYDSSKNILGSSCQQRSSQESCLQWKLFKNSVGDVSKICAVCENSDWFGTTTGCKQCTSAYGCYVSEDGVLINNTS